MTVSVNLTRQQLCAELNISESTVIRLEREGMPYMALSPRMKRYDVVLIKKWLEERACHIQTSKGELTSRSWSQAREYIESCQKARRRVMPS